MAMDPVNNVRIGNSSIGNAYSKNSKSKKDELIDTAQNQQQQTKSSYNPDDVLAAMGLEGSYNMMNINKTNSKGSVDPTKYLSEERISDIEAGMAEFESGVNEALLVLENEFPGMFTEEQKYALAAQIFAAE